MRLLAVALLCGLACLSGAGSCLGQTGDPADPATAAARQTLERFKAALGQDAPGARRIFEEEILESEPRIRQGFLRFLDGEWDQRKREYLRLHGLKTKGRAQPAVSAEMQREARKHRETLAKVRSLSDDDAMKKALQAEGWPALEALERLFTPATRDPADEIPELAAAKESALLAGELRRRLREEMLEPEPPDPAEELAALLPDPAEARLSIPAKARAVLRRNSGLAAELPAPEAQGIAQLNRWRILAGLEPLAIDPKLCEAARDHSRDMAEQGFFSHTNPAAGKSSPSDRARNFGTSASAENIAVAGSPAEANRSWFGSPGHHRNMFGGHSVAGLGNHGRHWTQMFR